MLDTPPDMPAALRWGVYLFQAVGFPAMVAGVFLWRLNGKLTTLVDAMKEVAHAFRENKDWTRSAIDEIRRELRSGRR